MSPQPKQMRPHESAAPSGPRRALIVDDSRVQRRILAASLKRWGFEVYECESAEAALDLCHSMQPDFVLSDWMMPGMDGLQFCRAFRGLDHGKYGYFILLTSKKEKGEVAQGLDAGADDFLTKPVSSDELRARMAAGDRILSMHRELSDKNRLITDTLGELQGLYDSIDKDLMQAKKIQQSLVPEQSRNFGAATVSLLLKPSGHIGGDLVGMFSPGPNRLGMYGVDVSGHGITSAMLTARLGSYLSASHFEQNVAMERRFNRFFALRPPEDVAETLNNRFVADAGVEQYFTMAYAIADLRHGLIKLVQAGHPHPLLIRQDGRCEFVGDGGLPIGLIPDVGYTQIQLQIQPGDRLLFYSDGFTECVLKSGEMLDEDGLLRLVAETDDRLSGEAFLDALYWRLCEEMCPDQGCEDDVSAALLDYHGEET